MRELAAFCSRCGHALAAMPDRPGQGRCSNAECGRITYDSPIPVVAAIVERQGSVVLVRSKGWPPEWFGLVTGFLEPGETAESGARREVEEELGLPVTELRLVGLYPFFEMNQLIIAYHVIAGEGEVRLDHDELEAWKAVPIERLKPWPFGTGDAVKDWLRGRAAITMRQS
jgi:NAD+ diphosphatase